MRKNMLIQGRTATLIKLFSIALLLIWATGCGGSGGSDSGGNEITPTQNDMLNKLGVNTDIGARVNPAGEYVSDDYNPMLRRVTQLAKRSEIFFAGTQGAGLNAAWTPDNKFHAVLDWPSNNATDFKPYNMSGEDSWLKLPKAAASGDLDGDGIDEIFIAYRGPSSQVGYDELAFRVIKRNKEETYSIIADKTAGAFKEDTISEYPDNYWWANNFNVACGDVDGNSQSETLIAFNGSVYLIGDSSKDYALMQTISYPKSPDTAYKLLKISAGDLDNDGMDEFVVVENSIKTNTLYGSAMYHIYTGVTLTELDSDTITVTEGSSTVTLHSSNCAVGDLDADGLNEILFIGLPENSSTCHMMILEPVLDADSGSFEFNFKPDFESFGGRTAYRLTPICAIADFDRDGKKELLGLRYIYENLSETTDGKFTRKKTITNTDIDIYYPVNADPRGSNYDCSLAVGDIDVADEFDEEKVKGADIVYISDDGYELYCLGFNNAGEWVRKGTGNITDTRANYPYVTMGDYDGDGIAVEFLESETLFSDPHPIAVLAANPFWEGIDMAGKTSFGTTTGQTADKEKSIGFSVGFSIGYESGIFFGPWKSEVEVKRIFESSFDWTAKESVSINESYTYSTVNEDKVVFSAVPYDVYYYSVIQAPDPEMVDKVITVNLPRKPVTLPVERTYYNANNGGAMDIDSSVLYHIVGDPMSYPTKETAEELIASGGGQGIMMSTSMMTVGQGSGNTSIEMSVDNANGFGTAFDISNTINAEVGAGGFTAGASSGFHYGESYSITTSTKMLYGGSVGNIPAGDWDPELDLAFSWGLFSYKTTLGNEDFIVVQYYTSPVLY